VHFSGKFPMPGQWKYHPLRPPPVIINVGIGNKVQFFFKEINGSKRDRYYMPITIGNGIRTCYEIIKSQ